MVCPHFAIGYSASNSIHSFFSYDKANMPAFPFHETCYKILCRTILGHENIKELDKDILYGAMRSLAEGEWLSCLDICYGDISGNEQYWECVSGEEV